MQSLADNSMNKWYTFEEILKQQGRAAVAFSGGVDSALLIKLCVDILGAENTLALTAVSQLQAGRELGEARRIAELAGARLIEVPIDALAVAEVVANPPDRCYYCKKAIFSTLMQRAREEGFDKLMDGSNASDRGDWRPGKKAATELGAVSPFDMAGITKAEIRAKSMSLKLPNWNAPAAACLASRIPYGTALDADVLRRVEVAEDALIELGFVGCRVRVHGDVARIEAGEEDTARLLYAKLRGEVTERIKALGFGYVALDLEGYRMGSLNSAIGKQGANGSR